MKVVYVVGARKDYNSLEKKYGKTMRANGYRSVYLKKETQLRGRVPANAKFFLILDTDNPLVPKLKKHAKRFLNVDRFYTRLRNASTHINVLDAFADHLVPSSGQANEKFLKEEAEERARKAEGIYVG